MFGYHATQLPLTTSCAKMTFVLLKLGQLLLMRCGWELSTVKDRRQVSR